MPKVHIINGDRAYLEMFERKGWTHSSAEDADLIQFTGGADVSPRLYGEALHPNSQCNLSRDDREKEVFDRYQGKKPLAGICRGGQFLNVMCGGKMYQHHSGHPYKHKAWIYSKSVELIVSSTHHQIMRPAKDGIVVMAANEGVIAERMDGTDIIKESPDWETESVFYPDKGVLCFQPHPEFSVQDKEVEECMFAYFQLLEDLMG